MSAEKKSIIEMLKDIKEHFTKKQIFMEGKLADGTMWKCEGEVKEGVPFVLVTAQGETAAPDGDHQLDDGKIVTTKEGVVIQVKEMPKEEEASMEEMKAKLADLEAQLAEAKASGEAAMKATAELKDETAAQMDAMGKEFAAILKESTTKTELAAEALTKVAEEMASAIPSAKPAAQKESFFKTKETDWVALAHQIKNIK